LLGTQSSTILPASYPDKGHAVPILSLLSLLLGLCLWGLSEWFFLVSVGSLWEYVFPASIPLHSRKKQQKHKERRDRNDEEEQERQRQRRRERKRHNKKKKTIPFQMTFYSFVFPNTALVTATLALAKALDCHGLRVYGSVLAAALVVVWAGVFGTMLRCLWRRELLWPEGLDKK
ncbi:voltage-dependent anion channel, partial [Xylariaceae sp. FL0594]